MKPIPTLILMASISAAATLMAAEPAETAPDSTAAARPVPTDPDAKFLRMNFRDASLEQVLSYLSEAAGFIINIKPGTSIRGKVTVMSNDLLTKEEALGVLNTMLNENNLGAIEHGRTLSIMPRDEIKIAGIPVMAGADPDKIPITDRIVTQIMPVRFVEASQLLKDLQPLVSIQTTMTANEAGNEILMTDTQANIHKVAEIIHAIDAGAEDFSMLKVFSLTNANPTEMADMLTQLFSDDTSRQGSGQSGFSNPFAGRFGGRFAALAGGGNQGAQGASNSQNQRIKKRNRVVAYADQRTASVVVSASRDLMDEIEDVVRSLDDNRKGKKYVSMYDIGGTDPAEVYPVLQELFQKYGTASTKNNAASTSALQTRSSSQSSSQTSGSSSTSRTGMGQSSRTGGGGGGAASFP